MSQKQNTVRMADNEARAITKYVNSSPQKVNLVAQLIRGKSAERALIDLEFCNKAVAEDVKQTLRTAIANAENNHNLDIDRLYVSEATVGKTMLLKRMRIRGRGRSAGIQKFFSRLTVVVRERDADNVAPQPQSKPKAQSKPAPAKAEAPAKKAAPKSTAKKAPAKTKTTSDKGSK